MEMARSLFSRNDGSRPQCSGSTHGKKSSCQERPSEARPSQPVEDRPVHEGTRPQRPRSSGWRSRGQVQPLPESGLSASSHPEARPTQNSWSNWHKRPQPPNDGSRPSQVGESSSQTQSSASMSSSQSSSTTSSLSPTSPLASKTSPASSSPSPNLSSTSQSPTQISSKSTVTSSALPTQPQQPQGSTEAPPQQHCFTNAVGVQICVSKTASHHNKTEIQDENGE